MLLSQLIPYPNPSSCDTNAKGIPDNADVPCHDLDNRVPWTGCHKNVLNKILFDVE